MKRVFHRSQRQLPHTSRARRGGTDAGRIRFSQTLTILKEIGIGPEEVLVGGTHLSITLARLHKNPNNKLDQFVLLTRVMNEDQGTSEPRPQLDAHFDYVLIHSDQIKISGW